MLGHAMLMAAGGGAKEAFPTTWNPADSSTNMVFTNGNLTATNTTTAPNGQQVSRATTSKSSGKWYFEVFIDVGGASNYSNVGIATSAQDLYSTTNTANAWNYYQQNGNKSHSGVSSAYGSAYATGHTVGVAVDLDAGKIWWSNNGVWIASGNPESGLNPAFSDLASETVFPMIEIYASNGSTLTGRFLTVDQIYTAPNGFLAWG